MAIFSQFRCKYCKEFLTLDEIDAIAEARAICAHYKCFVDSQKIKKEEDTK